MEGLAFSKSSDDYRYEGDGKEPPDKAKAKFILSPPNLAGQPLEKLRYGELCRPKAMLHVSPQLRWWFAVRLQGSIHDPRDENQSASNFAITNVGLIQAVCSGVIGAPYHDKVNECHSAE